MQIEKSMVWTEMDSNRICELSLINRPDKTITGIAKSSRTNHCIITYETLGTFNGIEIWDINGHKLINHYKFQNAGYNLDSPVNVDDGKYVQLFRNNTIPGQRGNTLFLFNMEKKKLYQRFFTRTEWAEISMTWKEQYNNFDALLKKYRFEKSRI